MTILKHIWRCIASTQNNANLQGKLQEKNTNTLTLSHFFQIHVMENASPAAASCSSFLTHTPTHTQTHVQFLPLVIVRGEWSNSEVGKCLGRQNKSTTISLAIVMLCVK